MRELLFAPTCTESFTSFNNDLLSVQLLSFSWVKSGLSYQHNINLLATCFSYLLLGNKLPPKHSYLKQCHFISQDSMDQEFHQILASTADFCPTVSGEPPEQAGWVA